MRNIERVIIHCSATPNDRDISAADIKVWHTVDNGWSDIGYHWIIRRDGTLEAGRPEDKGGAHCLGYNATSIGICVVGNDKFTGPQYDKLRVISRRLAATYNLAASDFYGHYELDSAGKTCPNLDAELLRKFLFR